MPKAINMTGGLGRIVCALPALKLLQEKEPDTIVVMNGWDDLYLHTNLNTVESSTVAIGALLENYDVITPEPYYQAGYRKGVYDMRYAFALDLGVEFGNTIDYGIKLDPALVRKYLSHFQSIPEAQGKPLAMIQVKASGDNLNIRDLNEDTAKNAIFACKANGYFPVLVGDLNNIPFNLECYNINNTALSDFITLIAMAELFIGGDSAGMHLARAFGKKGIIYLTSTAGTRYYPDWFTEFRHPDHPVTFEHPRLFRAEQKQSKLNLIKGVNNYSISEEDFNKAIQDIRE
jgi:hypothetical protein